MDQINTTQETEIKSSLHTVTPLSKYLALTLFVLMPFIGGWIGYTYAPTKVLEIEKVVIKEVPTEAPLEKQSASSDETSVETTIPVVDPKTVKAGDTFGDFIVTEVYYNDSSYSIAFSGSVIVSGTIYPAEITGPGIKLDEASALKMPTIIHEGEVIKASHIDLTGPLVETALPSEAIISDGNYTPYHITAEIKDYVALSVPKDVTSHAELVKIIELKKE